MRAIQIPMIRKNDEDLLNVCNPSIASDFDLLVSLSPLSLSFVCLIFLLYSNLKLWYHFSGKKMANLSSLSMLVPRNEAI